MNKKSLIHLILGKYNRVNFVGLILPANCVYLTQHNLLIQPLILG